MQNTTHRREEEEDEAMIDEEEAEEVVEDDGDAAMDSGDDDEDDFDISQPDDGVEGAGVMETIQLQNDSAAHFDHHKDSLFCIAQHPLRPEIVATGGGDDTAFIWDSTPQPTPEAPLLPRSYESAPNGASELPPGERASISPIARLDGHDESVNAICFTLPKGEYIATGTLAGRLGIYAVPNAASTTPTPTAPLLASAKEVDEINWLAPCPNPSHPNTLAFGAGDGSVWVYTIHPPSTSSSNETTLTIVQTFFLHQAACTAGAWTPDGKLLATVSEDGSLYVWDVFGFAAAAGITNPTGLGGGQAVVGLTTADERFRVDGGLYSLAVSPGGGIVAVGGAGGQIRVVGLPRLASTTSKMAPQTTGKGGQGARAKAGGAKQGPAPASAAAGQAGQLLASLQAQSDGIETLDFSQPPLTLLAAGSVDGSIAIFDAGHNFAVRRMIRGAHVDEQDEVGGDADGEADGETSGGGAAVIQVSFVKTPLGSVNENAWVLTSCGNDGVVRRWDVRGTTTTAGPAAGAKGLLGAWHGHRGGGEGGGVLGFVQGGLGGKRIVTAGDDGVALVFEMP